MFLCLCIYGCVPSLNSLDYNERIKALKNVTDQNVLQKVAREDEDWFVRQAAVDKITDQLFLQKVACEDKSSYVRSAAIDKITDQNVLQKVACEDENRGVRYTAVDKITDQLFLQKVAREDEDWFVRQAAVDKITDQNVLQKVACESKYSDVRQAAVSKMTDQSLLLNISQTRDEWDIRKAAFNKLNESSLDALINNAKDASLVLAAEVRLGRINWSEAFNKYGNSNETLGHVIGATAIVSTPKPASRDVTDACQKFIKLGDSSRIPELISLLNEYGDVSLAEDYMNCGEKTLESAGCSWGNAHGYQCTTGYGSNRVRWGSGRK